jgi:2-dehydro-3-deoxygluconokinase
MIGTVGEGLYELGVDEGAVHGPVRHGFGGDAANTAVMAARLGAPARVCGRVGGDALGRLLLAFWERCRVDTRWVTVDEAPTGIYVNERLLGGGSRFHYHRRGSAGSRLSPADVTEGFLDGLAALHYTGVTLAISSSAGEAARTAARRARERNVLVSFAVNHRPALGGDPREAAAAARSADVVFVSLEEAATVLGASSPEEVSRALGAGPAEVVVTLGEGGAVAFAGSARADVAAPAIDVVDASGAGDALAAVYLMSRLAGAAPERALERAVATASLSCRAYGAALSYPDAAAVEALSYA